MAHHVGTGVDVVKALAVTGDPRMVATMDERHGVGSRVAARNAVHSHGGLASSKSSTASGNGYPSSLGSRTSTEVHLGVEASERLVDLPLLPW